MGDFTYEHLFDALRRERSREELQELEEDFYGRAQAYIAETAAEARKSDVLSADGDRLRTQLQNASKLLKELYDRRERKVMLLALNKARTGSSIIDTSALLRGERSLFEEVVNVLRARREDVLARSPAPAPKAPEAPVKAPEPQKPPEVEEKPAPGTTVRITAQVPKFMGADQQTFGPFEEGQTVDLPERIARILIKKGRAEQA